MEQDQNLKESAYEYIIHQILNGPLGAGKVVDVERVGSEMGISRTPVKEALIQLESEGIIWRNGRYFTVFLPSEEDIMDLYEVRSVLEAQAARLTASRATDGEIEKLRKLIENINEMSSRADADALRLSALNGSFHSALSYCSRNEKLEKYTSEIRLKLLIVRTSLFICRSRRADEAREHSAVFEAIRERDPELAWTRMMAHQENVMKYLRERVIEEIV